jgi:hypothetical protein
MRSWQRVIVLVQGFGMPDTLSGKSSGNPARSHRQVRAGVESLASAGPAGGGSLAVR